MLEDVEAVVDTDLESGATLLGDHLIEGSDLAGETESSALMAALRPLIRERDPRRALLIGPSSAEFVELLPPDSRADLLVRHVLDARAIASVVTDRGQDRLFSGGFELFRADTHYDLIVLLGGGPEVLSPIAEGLTETQILTKAQSMLAPRGLLIYGAENALGLHDVLAAEAAVPADDDRRWYVGKSSVSQRPWVHRELLCALDELGLHRNACLLGYPSPQAPDLVLDDRVDDPAVQARVAHELPRVFADHFSRRAATRNAGPFVDLVLHAGLQTHLAPAWYLLLSAEPQEVTLPALVVAEPDTPASWSTLAVYDTDGRCTLTWSDGADATDERTSLEISRTLTAPSPTPGTGLERALRAAAAGSDHATMRALVRQYRAWVEGQDDDAANPPAPGQRWFATPDNVILATDGSLVLADGSWTVARADAAQAAFLHGLRVFATRLLAAGEPHPWALPVSPDEVTRTLAAMAGMTATPGLITAVAEIEVSLGLALGELVGDPAELLTADLAAGEQGSHLPEASATGFRELLGQVRALTSRARAQKRQIGWLEGTLKMRDQRVAEYDRLMFKLEDSVSYKVVRTLEAPKRVAKQRAKERVEKALPPQQRERARRLMKRVLDNR